jgi:iron complex transport system substrate-binding protein
MQFASKTPTIAQGLTIKDSLGRTVTIPEKLERIVSLVEPCTQILYALGAGDTVVGVDKYSIMYAQYGEGAYVGAPGNFSNYQSFCQEVPTKKNLGSPYNPSIEEILSLDPQLVFMYGVSCNFNYIWSLEQAGVKVIAINAESINDVYHIVQMVGSIVGKENEASTLINEVKQRLDAVANKIEAAGQNKPKVYFEWTTPLATGGGESFSNELIAAAGGENIFGDMKLTDVTVSEEEIAYRNPDIIIIQADNQLAKLAEAEGKNISDVFLQERPVCSDVSAVINGRVYTIEGCYVTYDLLFIIGVERFAQWFYPNLF